MNEPRRGIPSAQGLAGRQTPAFLRRRTRPIGLRVGRTPWRGPMASQSRNNVRKRGGTWTYYVYVTDGAGDRNTKVPA